MKTLKKIGFLITFIVVGFIGFLGYIIITDFDPNEVEATTILNDNNHAITGQTFTITTFNIGYCGLDAAQDFFMDGGTMSRSSSEEQTQTNLEAVIDFIDRQNSDFYLLQEVDVKGSRSFNVNQQKAIYTTFDTYSATYSYNFKAKWIPIPVFNPLGSAYSGLMNLSKYSVNTSTRYKLPGKEPFPKRYFDLDRSIMEDVYTLANGRKLYLINIHLSAYDKGGTIRSEQVQFIINHINEIYDDGENYIIFGGDWNHLLDNDKLNSDLPEWVATLPDNLFDTGFHLAYDTTINTVRSVETPYQEGVSFETVIDGFLVSPNIYITSVMGHDLGFENSDHNPVSLTFTLLD